MAALGFRRSGCFICDTADAGLAEDEPARLFLRVHDGCPRPAAGSGGRSIRYPRSAMDRPGQEVPRLHLSVSRDFRGEQSIGLYEKPCG
jgi:hypothetical protein